MLKTQEDIIVALTKGCGTVKFIGEDSEIPSGCGTEVVTSDLAVHIPVQVSLVLSQNHDSSHCTSIHKLITGI